MSMKTSEAYLELVNELKARSLAGDEFAIRTIAAMALLIEGWRYGDPDPTDGPDGDGGESVEEVLLRLAA